MKIVINTDYGGFGLSHEGVVRYAEIKGLNLTIVDRIDSVDEYDYYIGRIEEDNYLWSREIDRDDPALVQTVEELGSKANDRFADLKVVEIPDDVKWDLCEYDGMEWIAEKHRTWR